MCAGKKSTFPAVISGHSLQIYDTELKLKCPGFRWNVPSWQHFVFAWYNILINVTTQCVYTVFMPVWHRLRCLSTDNPHGAQNIEGPSVLNCSLCPCDHVAPQCAAVIHWGRTDQQYKQHGHLHVWIKITKSKHAKTPKTGGLVDLLPHLSSMRHYTIITWMCYTCIKQVGALYSVY